MPPSTPSFSRSFPAFNPACCAIYLIHPDNAASIRVAQKCGFHERQRATYHGEPTIVFERSAARK